MEGTGSASEFGGRVLSQQPLSEGRLLNALASPVPDEQWKALCRDGFLPLRGAFRDDLESLEEAVNDIQNKFPFGFKDPHYYTGMQPVPLTTPRNDGRILIPYIGFLDTRLLSPLANPILHDLLERIVGKDFYLSNTWYQVVPPNTPRLGYHKDPRGSISLNIMLDDISTGMGSTCVVPGSHINTPPAAFCMSDIHARHPQEADIVGAAGDGVLFSTETWHARSRNESNRTTRRLFYNFYSRSSRSTTTWNGIVSNDQLEAARASLPREYAHMFKIDPAQTEQLSRVAGNSLRRLTFSRSRHDDLIGDFFYAIHAYGKTPKKDSGFLLPFTTGLTGWRRFSFPEYLGKLKPIPTLKNIYVLLREYLKETFLGTRRTAKNYD